MERQDAKLGSELQNSHREWVESQGPQRRKCWRLGYLSPQCGVLDIHCELNWKQSTRKCHLSRYGCLCEEWAVGSWDSHCSPSLCSSCPLETDFPLPVKKSMLSCSWPWLSLDWWLDCFSFYNQRFTEEEAKLVQGFTRKSIFTEKEMVQLWNVMDVFWRSHQSLIWFFLSSFQRGWEVDSGKVTL